MSISNSVNEKFREVTKDMPPLSIDLNVRVLTTGQSGFLLLVRLLIGSLINSSFNLESFIIT